MERELQELRERMSQVEKWKTRRDEIERELAEVLLEGGHVLEAPASRDSEAESERPSAR